MLPSRDIGAPPHLQQAAEHTVLVVHGAPRLLGEKLAFSSAGRATAAAPVFSAPARQKFHEVLVRVD